MYRFEPTFLRKHCRQPELINLKDPAMIEAEADVRRVLRFMNANHNLYP